MITYQVEKEISSLDFIDILERSGLHERRPVTELERIVEMLKHANLIITARLDGKIIGVARSLTDFVFCTYLSDLAVDKAFQKQGLGKELIRQTKMKCPQAKLILLSAPNAVEYYPRIGMRKFDHCFIIDSVDEII